jgi:hypothetical protein
MLIDVQREIQRWTTALRDSGAKDVDQYERKLKSLGGNDQKVFEMLSEARAALHFLTKGWQATMRDRPDLLLECEGQTLYAEVKHMNEKKTDRRDTEVMAAAAEFEFVPIGNVIADEQSHGWQQMCAIAINKEPQYADGEQNLLIFVSYSESLDLLLPSAVNEFDDAVRAAGAASPLRKLGGMMMFSTTYGPRSNMSNIDFRPTSDPFKPISHSLTKALGYGQLG